MLWVKKNVIGWVWITWPGRIDQSQKGTTTADGLRIILWIDFLFEAVDEKCELFVAVVGQNFGDWNNTDAVTLQRHETTWKMTRHCLMHHVSKLATFVWYSYCSGVLELFMPTSTQCLVKLEQLRFFIYLHIYNLTVSIFPRTWLQCLWLTQRERQRERETDRHGEGNKNYQRSNSEQELNQRCKRKV